MDYWPQQTFTAETVNQVGDVEDLSVGNCAEQPRFRAVFQVFGKLLQEARGRIHK
jgi:hypothetical protein